MIPSGKLVAGLGAIFTLGWAAPAMAYIGPGAGLSLLGALWAVVLAVGAALLFLLFWPLRRLLRQRRRASASTAREQREEAELLRRTRGPRVD